MLVEVHPHLWLQKYCYWKKSNLGYVFRPTEESRHLGTWTRVLLSSQHSSVVAVYQRIQSYGVLPGNHLDHVRGVMTGKQLPATLPEFEQFQGTSRKNIFAAFERCVVFDSKKRPTAREVLQILPRHGKRDSAEEVLLENKSPKVCPDYIKLPIGKVQTNDWPCQVFSAHLSLLVALKQIYGHLKLFS